MGRCNRKSPDRGLCLAEPLERRVLLSTAPQLAAVIGTGTADSNPRNAFDAAGTLYFVADGGNASGLYRTDGTAAGTVPLLSTPLRVLQDLPHDYASLNGVTFFAAGDSSTGPELWRTDGNAAGTQLLKDLRPGAAGSSPIDFTRFGNEVYFFALSPSATNNVGEGLWKTDGTAAGTVLVKDFGSGNFGGKYLPGMVVANGALYFFADGGASNRGLFKTDGTTAGTVLVKDIEMPDVQFASLAVVGNTVYFYLPDPTNGSSLWVSDGTAAGTKVLRNYAGGAVGQLEAVGSTLFFSANDGVTGTELWKSNGTAAGTVQVADINPGPNSSSPISLTADGKTLFFYADDGTDGNELWKSDGTAAGTRLVKDINPGFVSSLGTDGASSLPPMLVLNGKLFFAAKGATDGTQLWESDGTDAGTIVVREISTTSDFVGNTVPVPLAVSGGAVYFRATDVHGAELWRTDGTAAGTTLVKDINTNLSGTDISGFFDYHGTLLFAASDDIHGTEPWRSDGTAAGTSMIEDIDPGAADSMGQSSNGFGYSPYFTESNGVVYFAARDGGDGRELWRTDGTAAGTYLVKDLNPGSASSNPRYLSDANGTLYFIADDAAGPALWKSNGTAAGTLLVNHVSPATGMAAVGNRVVFGVLTPARTELWGSDGTAAGTVMLADLGPYLAMPDASAVLNGKLFFEGTDADHGSELWSTDGTPAGTALLKDINPGSASSFPVDFTSAGGRIYFVPQAGSPAQVWMTDGTANGTVPTDIQGTPATSFFDRQGSVVVGDVRLFLVPNFGFATPTLYALGNGTAQQLETVITGSGAFDRIGYAAGAVFFNGFDPVHGAELWSQGIGTTVSGTVYNDANHNGHRDAGEAGLGGVTLYIDANGNGRPDAGELTTVSAADGSYAFAEVPVGTAVVREVVPAGDALTAPTGYAGTVASTFFGQASGPTFGNVAVDGIPLNFSYLLVLAQNYGRAATFIGGDLNGDAMVDFSDLLILAQHYGRSLTKLRFVRRR